MSDNDVQEPVETNEETVEFSAGHFGEEPTDTVVEEAKPDTEPAADTTAEKPAEPTETPSEEEAKPEETPEGDTPAEPEAEKSESELKGMTRAERRDYFEGQKREQTREVAEVVNQNYQPQDVTQLQEAYMNQGYDEGTSLMLARQDVAEQKAQIAEATTEIAELNANLRVDTMEAQATFDWMNPTKKDDYDKELHELAAQVFSQGITTDPRTGQIIEARMTPMQAAQIVEKIRNSGTAKAQIQAQKAAESQMAAAAPPTSTAPPSSVSAEDKQAAGLERAMNNVR